MVGLNDSRGPFQLWFYDLTQMDWTCALSRDKFSRYSVYLPIPNLQGVGGHSTIVAERDLPNTGHQPGPASPIDPEWHAASV